MAEKLAVLEMLTQLDGAIRAIGSTAAAVRAQVSDDVGEIAASVARATELGDQLGGVVADLTDKIQQGANIWSEELQLQFDLLNVGGQRLDTFIAQWGDAVIQTEQGAQTIREALNSLDPRGREQEIQDLIAALRIGSDGIGQALDFLSRAQGKYADELRKTVEAVLSGKVPIEKLLALIKQIQAQFANSPFEDLAQALADALRTGGLG